ncbi:putative calcium-binding protein CML21 isoform X1 [Bidens hawaiensis]|uniref:putative calcium-binding protein CML21 isoform X1 n=2 Tax=Bidens hawaiensis TaxID=980011 RepID=UPI00404A9FB8
MIRLLQLGLLIMGDGSGKESLPTAKLEAQILEAVLKRESKGTSIKSINRIILKFPKIDENLRKCKVIFEQFDEDKSGAIDLKELKHCFEKLQVKFTNEEINEIFKTCDLNDDMGISFNEFIVLLCLVYLLKEDGAATQCKSRMGIPDLEATFETLVESFVFLDSNKDGHVSKNEMICAIEETKQSDGPIALKRFEEMDWDKNGTVNFKEFLFAFTRWVGFDDDEDGDED